MKQKTKLVTRHKIEPERIRTGYGYKIEEDKIGQMRTEKNKKDKRRYEGAN